MTAAKNKRILLGVTGGIAAYKSAILARRLIVRGCEVRVVMTRGACEFITPLTMQAVSGHAVHQHLLDADAESGMGHIQLARWAQHIIIAPATANFIAKLAHGNADDLLSAVVLASDAEVSVAPAMNRKMWEHAATQRNINTLREFGVRIIGPGVGDQACFEVGAGRMSEPEEIADAITGRMRESDDGADAIIGGADASLLAGVNVVVTAGPTWEAIDPVRGISNRSSGKMGYAMAQAALAFGARVILVSGATRLDTPCVGSRSATRVEVGSAQEMMDAVKLHINDAQLFIGVAAVADYRPRKIAAHKIKKKDDKMTIELIKNPDILARVAALKNAPFTVGFALESENEITNARQKLAAKKVDVIAVNTVTDGTVFGADENEVTLIYKNGNADIKLNRTDKQNLARQILENIAPLFNKQKK